MSRHIWQSTRVLPTTHVQMRTVAKKLVKVTHLSEKEKKTWLAYCLERARQDGRTLKAVPTNRCWAHVAGQMVSRSHVVKQLLFTPTKTENLTEYANLTKSQIWARTAGIATKARHCKLSKHLEWLLGESYSNRRVLTLLRWSRIGVTAQNGWLRIKRGRDLFIQGLGPFNINKTVSSYGRGELRLVKDFRAAGYCLKAYDSDLLLEDEYWSMKRLLEPSVLPYLVRWWCNGNLLREHGIHSDLLVSAVNSARYENRDVLTVPPAVLIQERLDYAEQLYQPRVSEIPDKGTPYRAYPTLTTDQGVLCSVANYQDLDVVGKGMHNCALSYHSDLIHNNLTLIVLRDDQGKPVALGQFDKSGSKYELSQLYGPCNQRVTKEIRKVYNQYARVITDPVMEPVADEGGSSGRLVAGVL